MTRIRLTGWEPDAALDTKAYLAWGQLVKLCAKDLQMHFADLAYDLDAIRKWSNGVNVIAFYWSFDEYGTEISQDDTFPMRKNKFVCAFYKKPDGEFWFEVLPR